MKFNLILSYKKRLFTLSLYVISSIVPTFLSLLINPFLAANLSPNDYAIIGYFTSFNILVLPLVGFSFVSYYTRSYFLIDETRRLIMINTLLISLLIFGPIIFVLFLFGFYIYAHNAHISFPFFPYALISLLPTFFTCFFSFYLNEKKMEGKAIAYFKANLTNTLLLTGLSILMVVVFKWGAIGRLGAILIVSFLIWIFSLKTLLNKTRFDKQILFDAIKFCWPLTFSAILYFFLSGVDKIFLERLNDNTTFGYYNVAFQISAYTGLLGTALITTFDPDIYKAIANNNVNRLFKIILVVIVPCIAINVFFILFAKPLINILTYGRYLPSTNYARILALRNITTPFYFLVSGIIIGYGYPKIELINRTIGALLSIILFKFLISKYGFFGASWGQVFSMLMMTLISVLFVSYKKRDLILKAIGLRI